jgi:hypothetical protein
MNGEVLVNVNKDIAEEREHMVGSKFFFNVFQVNDIRVLEHDVGRAKYDIMPTKSVNN